MGRTARKVPDSQSSPIVWEAEARDAGPEQREPRAGSRFVPSKYPCGTAMVVEFHQGPVGHVIIGDGDRPDPQRRRFSDDHDVRPGVKILQRQLGAGGEPAEPCLLEEDCERFQRTQSAERVCLVGVSGHMKNDPINYPWERLWSSRDRPVELGSDGLARQLLVERWFPGGERLFPISRVAHTPCLILLGDAGMGKTRSMEAHCEAVRAEAMRKGAGDCVRWVSLATYSSAAEVAEDVFRHPDVGRCVQGTGTVRLFLDSYDEGVVRLGTLGDVIRRELERLLADGLPVERLVVRIISRPALAPDDLLPSLQRLFGPDKVGVYVLAPLSREEVTVAAKAEGVNPERFLEEVTQRRVGPLAAKPLSLRMLLAEFAAGDALARGQSDLFHDACLRHCQAWNPSRLYPASVARRLTPEQTLAVAARIAAATILSGRSQLWIGPDHGSVGEAYVTVAAVCATDPGARFAEAEVREVLECGLFADAGEHAVRFYNQSVADYLAASHLYRSGLTPVQTNELLTVTLEGELWVVPQLVETAAWLEVLSPGTLREALKRDPEAWLGSSAGLSDANRAVAATCLLALYDSGEAYDDLDVRGHYHKLDHPGLAAILRPYLVDTTRHPVARRAAASIAAACGLTELQDELVTVALDRTAPGTVRQNAVSALGAMGDDATLARVRSLATESPADDPDDEIKGRALDALWPRVLTASEVLSALTERKEPRLTGAYCLFTGGRLGFASRLTPDQVLEALQWLAAQSDRALCRTIHAQVAKTVVRAAIDHMERQDILSSMADLAVKLLRAHEPLVNTGFFHAEDPVFPARAEFCRSLAAEIVARTAPDPGVVRRSIFFSPSLLTVEDLDWIRERAAAASDAERPVWHSLERAVLPAEEVVHA